MQFVRKIAAVLTPRELRHLRWLSLAILVMGLFEVVGVSSVFPFMKLVSNPEVALSEEVFARIYSFFGFSKHESFIIACGIGAFVLLAVSNLFTAFVGWLQQRTAWQISHNLNIRLLDSYLSRPYKYYLNENSATIQAKLYQEIFTFTTGVLLPVIELVAKSFVTIVIFTLLIIVDPYVALASTLSLCVIYAIIYFSRKRYLQELGQQRINSNFKRYNTLGEVLSGIKTFRVFRVQNFFFRRFEKASFENSKIPPKVFLITNTPRLIIQIFAFGGIIALTTFLYIKGGNIQGALPVLGLFALAAIRMLPAIQKVYSSFAQIKHNLPVLDTIYKDLHSPVKEEENYLEEAIRLPFEQKIDIIDLGFAYEEAETASITDINLSILKGQNIAFVGATGSGKTTLIDLIIGLFEPSTGGIYIDDQRLTPDNVHQWQNLIGYAPQEVMLFDDTVARNIAIGVEDEDIDWPHLHAVAQLAQIDAFIINELASGYQTEVGERGIRLSGGEKQRIGLARALYSRPAVLILDEATSALDTLTESNVIQALQTLQTKMTIITIAHRLSTVKQTDCIYLMEGGKIVHAGIYDDLLKQSETFREMAMA